MFPSAQPGELGGELFAFFAWEFDSAVLDVPGCDSQPRALFFDAVAWTLIARRHRINKTDHDKPVRCRDRLGGLLRYYHQEAA